MDQYIRDIGNFLQKEKESLPKAWKRLQEMIKNCSYRGITQQRLVHILYGEVSSHNRTILDVVCGGNLMLKPHANAIKIIEGMCSNPYNNSGDIMNRGMHQVETYGSQTELGKQMQDLSMKIEILMRAQAHILITTPSFPTYDKCGIMHGPREGTIDDKLFAAMDEINFVGVRDNSYNQYPRNFNQGQGFSQNQGMLGLNPCKIKGLDKRRDYQLFKKLCFNI